MGGAFITVNNVGKYGQNSFSDRLIFTGGTCDGDVFCEAGHLEAEGIAFPANYAYTFVCDTGNLDGSTFYGDLITGEITVDGDFSMNGLFTGVLNSIVKGTIKINSNDCLFRLGPKTVTCTRRANHRFFFATVGMETLPGSATIQLTIIAL